MGVLFRSPISPSRIYLHFGPSRRLPDEQVVSERGVLRVGHPQVTFDQISDPERRLPASHVRHTARVFVTRHEFGINLGTETDGRTSVRGSSTAAAAVQESRKQW